MILRKPYAFLIKHFKLIHTILSICMIYLLYKSYNIYKFLNETLNMTELTVEHDSVAKLFNRYMFILPWVIIAILIILLVVMFRKQKPKVFYFINIIIFIATIVIYNYLYSTISYMEANIVGQQTVKLAIDMVFLVVASQLISTIISLIRSIGLDLKKFDFGKDLMELEINELDNEEFEINVELDSNSARRNIKKRLRYARYVYIENKLLINTVVFILIATIGFIIYLNVSILNAHYDEGEYFSTDDYSISILKSYITSQDSRGKTITKKDESLLILSISVNSYNAQTLNLAKTEILVGENIYYPISDYGKSLVDLGEVYNNQVLSSETQNFLLVYEIPNENLDQIIIFRYFEGFDINSNSIKPTYTRVKLSPLELDDKVEGEVANEKEELVLNETLGNTSIKINSLELAEYFVSNYNFCLNRIECYKSIEYIKPNVNTNYDKALLKIDGVLTLDETKSITSLKNLYSVIYYFGRIDYINGDKTYSIDNFTEVEPKKYKKENIYYIEINKDVLNADKAYLNFKLRNKEYKFTILEK